MDLSFVFLLAAMIVFGIAALLEKSLIAIGLFLWTLSLVLHRL